MDHMVVHRIQGGKGWIREHKTSLQGKVTEPLSYAVHRSFQFLLLLLRNRLLIQRKLLHFLQHIRLQAARPRLRTGCSGLFSL